MLLKTITYSYLLYSGFISLWSSWKIDNLIYNNIESNIEISNLNYKKTLNKYSNIVEDKFYYSAWKKFTNKKSSDIFIPGIYEYLFRNQLNFEEKFAISNSRKAITMFLFRMDKKGSFIINNEGKTIMIEKFIIFNFFPIIIKWFGTLSENQKSINWNDSKLYHLFGVINKPKISEKMRKNSWNLEFRNQNLFVIESNKNKKFVYEYIH